MDNSFFTALKYEEVQNFKQWVDDNYTSGEPIREIWHPIVRFFCELKNVKETIDESVFINVEISASKGEAQHDIKNILKA